MRQSLSIRMVANGFVVEVYDGTGNYSSAATYVFSNANDLGNFVSQSAVGMLTPPVEPAPAPASEPAAA